jgi:prolyl-tRNA editing enzyme YbaK/EbsC (Cys-tRNA(Pro) deacylase)
MSEFAGRIGAGWIADHLDYRRLGGPVVVVGAGRAGSAAAERLLAEPAERVVLLHLFDLPDQRERLAGAFEDPRVRIHALDPERRDDAELVAALEGAAGVLFAVAVPQGKAPRVVSLDALRRHTDPRAMVVDVSIDERGAIHDPSLTESWELRRVIRHFESQLAPRRYRSVDNMPRTLPREASPAHGEVVLPYLAALLLLAAREGGFEPLMEHLGGLAVDLHAPDPATAPEGRRLDAYAQDLRNGLAFWPRRLKAAPTSRRLAVEDVVADRQGVLGFLFGQGVPCEFSVRPRDAASEPAKLREDYRYLPAPIRSSLERAVDLGIDGRVIYHPDIDGTQARYAALALGVRRSHVLKTMIVRNGDGRYLAAICEGDRELDLERIAELLGVAEVAMASPEEVREVTQHPPGGVPVLEVFGMDGVHPVLVSRGLLDHEWVVGSGGSEFVGLQINPAVLQRLKGRVEDITTPPSPP